MTQSIVIQVGQCGNQLGFQFWDLAYREHSLVSKDHHADECFFRTSEQKKSSLKARAVLVDMEENVVNRAFQRPLSSLFDSKQKITDVCGSGNNWAVGNKFYGKKYREMIRDLIRREAEHCDYLQSYFIMHSTGGGTGSGLGSAITEMLQDEYADVERFIVAVLPSANDDVITSPYNTILACKRLTECADCVFPIENQSLLNICHEVDQALPRSKVKLDSPLTSSQGCLFQKKVKPYDQMNNIVSNMMLNLTSHSRYQGSLNVDLSELSINLVPFPRLHYISSNVAPLYALSDVHIPPRRIDQMFGDAFAPHRYLLHLGYSPNDLNLACALLARGRVSISDIQRNIQRLERNVKFASWNPDGWKVGLCPVAPVGHPYALLTLKNTTAVKRTFADMLLNFRKLFQRKAHLHHFLEIEDMQILEFEEAQSSLVDLIAEYKAIT